MRKTYLAAAIIVAMAIGIAAVPETTAARQTKEKRSVKIEGASPENPVVYLGKSFDKKSGKEVEGYAIVHYARSASKKAKPSPTATCYGYLAKGAKWKSVEDWTVDPENARGLGADAILNNLTYDISKWEDATDGNITNGTGTNILGSGSLGIASLTLGETLDYKNEVEFASIDSPGAIAVTYIWGVFGGSLSSRQLVEWDQVYDDVDFDWSLSIAAVPGKMDFENIATHELGHSVGMDDLYTSSCSAQTMYGYASEGQDNKRSLESGDIAGINSLY